jgi:hypothetical protein
MKTTRNMKMTRKPTSKMIWHAVTVAVAGTLGLWSTAGPSALVRAAAGNTAVIAQYCAPPGDVVELHRLYCQHEEGSKSQDGNGA